MTPVEVLAAHQLDGSWCAAPGCDWEYDDVPLDHETAHAAHVLDALAKAGHRIASEANEQWGVRTREGDVIGFSIGGRETAEHNATVEGDVVVRRFVTDWAPAAAAETGGKA